MNLLLNCLEVSSHSPLSAAPISLTLAMGGGKLLCDLQIAISHDCDIQLVGIDLKTPSSSKAGFSFVIADAHFPPFASETFDLVVTIGVLEHVMSYETVLSEIRRILRPGAHALIACGPNRRLPFDSPTHRKMVTRYPDVRKMQDILGKANCTYLWADVVAYRIRSQAWQGLCTQATWYHKMMSVLRNISKHPIMG